MNDPHPSFAALIVWGLVAAALGYWLCRRRPWLALFWVAGSIFLPVLALLALAEPGAEPVPSYRLVAYIALAAGVVFPVLGAVAGGLRFWSVGAAMFPRESTGKPGDASSSRPDTSGREPKVTERWHRPTDDA
jgi:hypothetical protein